MIPPPEPPHWAKDLACALTIIAAYAVGFVIGVIWWAPAVQK